MAEEAQTQEVQTQQVEQTSTAEPTLDDVYNEYQVAPSQPQQPQQAQQTQQIPVQQQVRSEPVIPDPALDPEGHKAFMRSQLQASDEMKGILRAVVQHTQNFEAQRARAAEEADIKKAVETVNSKLNADPDFAEIAIAQRVRKDAKFKALWENRTKNPEALDKGLKALATELSKKFEFRVDPQLTENQRAMKEATQTKAVGAPPENLVDRLAKATGRDFDAELDRIRSQPSY
ncbi:hypothetical protein [Caudoviricetes sp.]|nr:hypothetical protein [Caudoviricetes sp.]